MLDHADEVLRGGTANYGRIYRVGDTVHRPTGAYTPGVHDLLRHLAAAGFDGAPRVVADAVTDAADEGPVEVLEYIEGVAAVEPLEPWARSDDALDSVGSLLRRLHDAAADFDPTRYRWQRPVPPRWRGTQVTHNDVNPGNVVFRDGRAVALIDFDLTAAGTRAWDLAVTACCWVPLRADPDVGDERAARRLDRLGLLLDGYGADRRLTSEVLAACGDANDWIAEVIRDASRRGHPAFARLWRAQQRSYERAGVWIGQNVRPISRVS